MRKRKVLTTPEAIGKGTTMRKRNFGISIILFIFSLLLVMPSPISAAEREQVVIAGAGPSTKVVERFVEYLGRTETGQAYNYVVPPKSIKHAGGIRSTEKNIFGRTGRPLNEEERSQGVDEIFLAKMPIAFVAGPESGVDNLTLDQVCSIFTGTITNWQDVGGSDNPIRVITREPSEALFQTLKKDVPCMNDVVDTKFLIKKDDHVVDMLAKTEDGKYAIGFGASRNFSDRLTVSGFDSGVNLGLVYQASNSDNALVMAAIETARSEEWIAAVKEMGLGAP